MIMLCERCCGVISDGESMVRYAHIDHAHLDGSITWVHTFVHTAACATPQVARHERRDRGTWDPSRGVGARRAA
jgi:hypothetical protein